MLDGFFMMETDEEVAWLAGFGEFSLIF